MVDWNAANERAESIRAAQRQQAQEWEAAHDADRDANLVWQEAAQALNLVLNDGPNASAPFESTGMRHAFVAMWTSEKGVPYSLSFFNSLRGAPEWTLKVIDPITNASQDLRLNGISAEISADHFAEFTTGLALIAQKEGKRIG